MDRAPGLALWFAAHARKLPWRTEPRDPYAVLVSELMLQQTQVSRVVERFPNFLERFPDLGALAAAEQAHVVAAWSGLGYYRRARALHALARKLSEEGRGLPRRASELERLPGVGPYTAAAVASLAHGEAVPVLDGNVLRVGARVLGLQDDPRAASGRRAITAWVRGLMEGEAPGVVNEALMELGATVCTPSSPRCADCPLTGNCRARVEDRQEMIPPPRTLRSPERQLWLAAVAMEPGGRWLLRRIGEGEVLRGLWLPPIQMRLGADWSMVGAASLLPFAVEDGLAVPSVRHSITYRRIEVRTVVFRVEEAPAVPRGWRWEHPESSEVPTSSLLSKLHKVVSRAVENPG